MKADREQMKKEEKRPKRDKELSYHGGLVCGEQLPKKQVWPIPLIQFDHDERLRTRPI